MEDDPFPAWLRAVYFVVVCAGTALCAYGAAWAVGQGALLLRSLVSG